MVEGGWVRWMGSVVAVVAVLGSTDVLIRQITRESYYQKSIKYLMPQTVLALRGSYGVGIEAAMVPLWIRAWTRSR